MEVFYNQPLNFFPQFKVCGIFIEHNRQFLLMRRHPGKLHGNHWNLPAGKLEAGEQPIEAAIREVHEESGILIPIQKVHDLGVLYFITPEMNFEFHLFFSSLSNKPSIKLADGETVEEKWWGWSDPIHPLIPGGQEVIHFCKNNIPKKVVLDELDD